MKLQFSTHINGKPTYFVERIHSGLIMNELMDGFEAELTHKGFNIDAFAEKHMKLHTLRNDEDNVWQRGVPIEFMVNDQNMNSFQFAPVLPVVNVQEVFMTYAHSDLIQISIDGRELFSYSERLQFALNDGFDSWEDFFKYFYPKIQASPKKCYKLKLIHWTNLRY